MKTIRLFLLLPALLWATTSVSAGERDSLKFDKERIYVGAHAALTTAESNFSSFGAKGFHLGWNTGFNAGYKFTDIWSLEVLTSWSQVALSEQNCCLAHNYILGSDFNRYHPLSVIPEGVNAYHYSNLKSRVFVQCYGLQVNFNVLGLFHSTKEGPWGLDVSPAIYAAGTHARIIAKDSKTPIAKNITSWHLGYGGQLFASYAIAENMKVGVYGAYTQYVGRPIDGLPRVHSTNYTVDAGVKFIFSFNKKKAGAPEEGDLALIAGTPLENTPDELESLSQEVVPEVVDNHAADSAIAYAPVATDTTLAEQSLLADSTAHLHKEEEAAVETQEAQENLDNTSKEEALSMETPFPIIYFSFNCVWIEPGQRAKIKEIAKALKADYTRRIRVIGWGDEVGGDRVNRRVSLQRAEAVKKRLEMHHIPAERIEVIGGGIAPNAPSPEEGRIAIIQLIP